MIYDNDEEEEDENEKLRRKACRTEIDENHRILREAEEKERNDREAKITFKTQKLIFPLWSMECILNEAIDNLIVYWLAPVVSLELENRLDS